MTSVKVSGLRIGELASLAGVTTRTVRYYERLGLLREPSRDASGFRRYEPSALLDLAEIRRLQALGLRLLDVAALRDAASGVTDRDELLARLMEIDASIGREIAGLEARRVAIGAIASGLAAGESILSNPEPASFARVEEVLRAVGASAAGIDVERRVWAAVETLELPAEWHAVIESGLASMQTDPTAFTAFAALLEVIAGLGGVAVDDPAVAEATHRLVHLAGSLRVDADAAIALLDDPAVASILHTVASGLSDAQQHAVAVMVAALEHDSEDVAIGAQPSMR